MRLGSRPKNQPVQLPDAAGGRRIEAEDPGRACNATMRAVAALNAQAAAPGRDA
jgi:hypothetical protein